MKLQSNSLFFLCCILAIAFPLQAEHVATASLSDRDQGCRLYIKIDQFDQRISLTWWPVQKLRYSVNLNDSRATYKTEARLKFDESEVLTFSNNNDLTDTKGFVDLIENLQSSQTLRTSSTTYPRADDLPDTVRDFIRCGQRNAARTSALIEGHPPRWLGNSFDLTYGDFRKNQMSIKSFDFLGKVFSVSIVYVDSVECGGRSFDNYSVYESLATEADDSHPIAHIQINTRRRAMRMGVAEQVCQDPFKGKSVHGQYLRLSKSNVGAIVTSVAVDARKADHRYLVAECNNFDECSLSANRQFQTHWNDKTKVPPPPFELQQRQ